MQHFVVLCAIVCVNTVPASKLDFQNARPCGVEASTNLLHHNPWLVFLEYYQHAQRRLLRCGGTLVSRRHVVTAAHCVSHKETFSSLVARLGEYDVSSERDCVGDVCSDVTVRINVSRVSVPKGFDGKEDDIAVLQLEEDAPYTDFIRPICLPFARSRTKNDDTYTAAGWGELTSSHLYSATKKIIPLPSWSTTKCRQAYRRLKLPEKIVCAGGEEDIDTCRGDSGGPLVLYEGHAELRGVISSGSVHCGTKGFPGIYTSVVDHLDFLRLELASEV